MTIVLFIAGLALLIIGAEALVRGSSRLAAGMGISPLVIGLTVVALGTSSPELAVGVKAALSGRADIVMGNVVGSNILNVLLVIGLSALIAPLAVSQKLVRFDVPLMIGVSAVVLLLSLDGTISRAEGAGLAAALALYVCFMIWQSRSESDEVREEYESKYGAAGLGKTGLMRSAVPVVAGLGMLVLGSHWLVESAVSFARFLGVSELVIGLTVVAVGTSLPEVVTSVIAAARGERDIAVGNVVGSNLFNLLGVLGAAGMSAPSGIEVSGAVIGFDIPVMIAVAFACLPIFFSGGEISRWEGGLLLGYYAAYTLYLFLAASRHDALPGFSAVMLYFAIPITLLTVGVIALRELRVRRGSRL